MAVGGNCTDSSNEYEVYWSCSVIGGRYTRQIVSRHQPAYLPSWCMFTPLGISTGPSPGARKDEVGLRKKNGSASQRGFSLHLIDPSSNQVMQRQATNNMQLQTLAPLTFWHGVA